MVLGDVINPIKDLLLLFDRPNEPVYTPKGDEGVLLNIPKNFLSDFQENIYNAIVSSTILADDALLIPVDNIELPDITFPAKLGRMDSFSLFIPYHINMAGDLIRTFMSAKTAKQLFAWATYARSHINPVMFNYALAVAMLHRTDTKDVPLPNFAEMFPDKYVDSQSLSKAVAEAAVVPEGNEVPIYIPRNNTGADNNIEHRLAYFREDVGVNLHHWHWHLVYPNQGTDKFILAKDRRGELFFYMHQQLLARYNFERLSNDLSRVKRLNNLREPIPEGYFPKLDSYVAGRGWPSRQDNTMPKDIIREFDGIKLDISDLERWRDRIIESIAEGFVVRPDGTRVELTEYEGIDIIGNIIENSSLSVNREYYGNLHNMGHVLLAFIHDPQHLHSESFSVMGDVATAMRDPVFYRWHAYINDICLNFKGSLPRYSKKRLTFQGIEIDKFETAVLSKKFEGKEVNVLHTHWQEDDIKLTRGLDFAPRKPVYARLTHLDKEVFEYIIEVNNKSTQQKTGTCRIFMGPKFNEKGEIFLLRDLNTLMIEMDKFVVTLKPGKNTIRRMSTESSICIPFERTYRDLDKGRGAEKSDQEEKFNFCGCGWPQNLLVPRGKIGGMPVYIYVIISDRYMDRIDQDEEGECHDAASFCGLRDRRYPDKQSMGYPFDRMPENNISYIEDFLTPNSKLFETIIKHKDIVKPVSIKGPGTNLLDQILKKIIE